LITPLKGSTNLVAKEYCSCNITEDGVLIMSEFAGAAAQLLALFEPPSIIAELSNRPAP
jgi:trehalose-6-phosphate synthase